MLDPFVELQGRKRTTTPPFGLSWPFSGGSRSNMTWPSSSYTTRAKARRHRATRTAFVAPARSWAARAVVLTLNVMTEDEAKGFNIPPDRRRRLLPFGWRQIQLRIDRTGGVV